MEAIHATEWLLNPEPYHTSWLSGRRWVEDLKDGYPDHMTDNIGVWPAVFLKLEQKLVLKGGLLPSRWVDTSEMLAIFFVLGSNQFSNLEDSREVPEVK